MKKFAMLAVVAAALFAAPVAAHAQEGFYAGAGYTNFSADDIDVGALTGRFGYRFHPNFAVEGEASVGIDDDDGVELDNSIALYGVGIVPVGEQFEFFARLGYHRTEVSYGPSSDEQDGFAGGVGGQWNVNERFGVRLEYTRLEGDDVGADAIGLSGVVRFN